MQLDLSCPQQVDATKVVNNTLVGKRCNVDLFANKYNYLVAYNYF